MPLSQMATFLIGTPLSEPHASIRVAVRVNGGRGRVRVRVRVPDER